MDAQGPFDRGSVGLVLAGPAAGDERCPSLLLSSTTGCRPTKGAFPSRDSKAFRYSTCSSSGGQRTPPASMSVYETPACVGGDAVEVLSEGLAAGIEAFG